MEKMVFNSPQRYRIIAVKKLLAENDIPVTSVKLHIRVEWGHGGLKHGQAGQRITETRERRDELNVPIEEFDEKLNDAQTFELYTAGEYEDAAIELVEGIDEERFFGDLVFASKKYDEAFAVYALLNKNNIPCDDIFPGADEYLLFVDPVYMDRAKKIIEQTQDDTFYKHKNRKAKEPPAQEYRRTNLFKSLFS
ncbi:MAG: hypothetical protein FWC64_12160 [Treponema sp.]|nr:hypothetical protein [Treponema sp.]